MKELDTIFGFPIIRDKENQTATIQSDCNHPLQIKGDYYGNTGKTGSI